MADHDATAGDAAPGGPPPDGRPETDLRRDISDELSDHLELSARAEQLRGEDEHAAQQHAVDAFGDPDAIAKRLYFDAMKGRLMRQNLQTAAILCLTLAVVLIGVLGLNSIQTNQRALLGAIESLGETPEPAPDPTPQDMQWSHVTVELVDESGRPFDAKGYEIRVSGELINTGHQTSTSHTLTRGNQHTFGPIRIGQHRLFVNVPGSRNWGRAEFTIWPGKETRMQVQCPVPGNLRPMPTIKVDWPDDLVEYKELSLALTLPGQRFSIGDVQWFTGEFFAIAQTSKVTRLISDSDSVTDVTLSWIIEEGKTESHPIDTGVYRFAPSWPKTFGRAYDERIEGAFLWATGDDQFTDFPDWWRYESPRLWLSKVPLTPEYNETTNTLTLSASDRAWARVRHMIEAFQRYESEQSQAGAPKLFLPIRAARLVQDRR